MLIHLQRPNSWWTRHPLINWDADKDAGTGDPPSDPPADKTPPEKTFTQSQVESMIAERLNRAEQSWKKKEADAKTKADQERAQKDGDLQKQLDLANTELDRLKPLEQQITELQERIDKLVKVLDDFYNAELTALPEDAQAMLKALPGDPPVEDRVKWLTENKARFAVIKPTGSTPPTPPATPPEKKPADKAPTAEAQAQARKSLKRVF